VSENDFVRWWQDMWSEAGPDLSMTIGIEPITGSPEHVELALPFRPDIGQLMGLFSAGALTQLADAAASALCLRTATTRGYNGFPMMVQFNANFVSNRPSARANARAVLLAASRSAMTAATDMTSDEGDLLMHVTSTHILKRPA
jgi:1,4-dihydroxy-2-naphthoyl-CoA hydrolase